MCIIKYKENIKQLIILFLLNILLTSNINATPSRNNHFLEFSLFIQNQTTDFHFQSNTYKSKSDLLGISWYEPFSNYFHAGLEFGYIEMTQINNPLLSAQYTSGQYAGLLFRFLPFDSQYFALTLNLNYRFNQAKGTSTNQETQFAWNEALVFGQLQYFPSKQLILTAATEYLNMNGEQRDSGFINTTTSFEGSKQLGTRLGISFITDRTGTVGFEWFTEFRQGSRLFFSRKF